MHRHLENRCADWKSRIRLGPIWKDYRVNEGGTVDLLCSGTRPVVPVLTDILDIINPKAYPFTTEEPRSFRLYAKSMIIGDT